MSSKAVALLSLTLAACARPPGVSPEVEARTIWEGRCANCHGPSGRGDGPAGMATSPPPRDFSDPAWQRQTSDGKIRTAILYGGAAAGLNPAMAANPDLKDRPAVTEALVALVRGWASEDDVSPAAAPAAETRALDRSEHPRAGAAASSTSGGRL